MYRIRIKKSAEKELAKLPLNVILHLHQKIVALSNNPFPPGYKRLKGFKGLFRIRAGDYRIIYTVEHERLMIEILKIGNRKDTYR